MYLWIDKTQTHECLGLTEPNENSEKTKIL
jgi:hypothetical protein